MSIKELYVAFNVDTAPEGNRHHRPGWVNTECPHCSGSHGYHLGFNLNSTYFSCYRCGPHKIYQTISLLLQVDYDESRRLCLSYKVYSQGPTRPEDQVQRVSIHPFKLPTNTTSLKKVHRRYLAGRGYDPIYLEEEWGLVATAHLSSLDKTSYKYRIIAPIFWEDRVVSFQGRDYTGKQSLRYLSCPMRRERIHHKQIIYRHRKAMSTVAIITEGIFDVWRFKELGAGTFGTGYTRDQMRLISKLFKRVLIAFDPERTAQKKAEELIDELLLRGVDTHNIILPSDPGALPQEEGDRIVKDFKVKNYVSGHGSPSS